MTYSFKSILLGVAQLALLASVGGKMLYDRESLPRVWVKTVPFDPSLPMRGRYVRLSLEVDNPARYGQSTVDLHVEDGRLVARPSDFNTYNYLSVPLGNKARIFPPVAFFISEHADDPSRHLQNGDELWVEVTVPPKGHPRPIRLGSKHDGTLTPLKLD